MNDKLNKIAEDRKERDDLIYTIDEDWSNYAPNCPDHPGVRRLRVSDGNKDKKAKEQDDIVWKCPVDGALFTSEGTIAEQTKGFAAKNNYHRNNAPIVDDGYDAANKLAKAMGYDGGAL